MSPQLRVETQKDENGRLNWIKIYKGRSKKPLRLEYIWDADGLTREIQFSGRRQDMLSIPQVASLINEKFMERIGLISKIETIEEIVNVNISSSSAILSVQSAVGKHVDIDIISSITLNINLASSAITLNIHETGTANVAITSSIQLDINIAASAITLNIHETGTANVAITSSIQLDMNIAASAITVNVHEAGTANVSITSSITVDMNITGATVNVPVETAEGAKVDVNIISTITLNVNLESQTANINVDIKAQTVDLNIKTTGGTNIFVDLLTQEAVFCRRTTISNNGATPAWVSVSGNNRRAKFFPKGFIGFIGSIDVYCRNTVAGDQTITVYISSNSSLGYVASAQISVPAFSAAGWRGATFNRMWLGDKLFIFVVGSHDNVGFGYDADVVGTRDCFSSTDAGASWTWLAQRMWIRVNMEGLTVSDVNVAGTVNTIEIPNTGTGGFAGGIVVPDNTETLIKSIDGAGIIKRLAFHAAHDDIEMRIEVDGVAWSDETVTGNAPLEAHWLNAYGYTPTTPQVQLLQFADAGQCRFVVTIPIEFKRNFTVRAWHNAGADKAVSLGYIVSMLK